MCQGRRGLSYKRRVQHSPAHRLNSFGTGWRTSSSVFLAGTKLESSEIGHALGFNCGRGRHGLENLPDHLRNRDDWRRPYTGTKECDRYALYLIVTFRDGG